jgi:hypothetical protein
MRQYTCKQREKKGSLDRCCLLGRRQALGFDNDNTHLAFGDHGRRADLGGVHGWHVGGGGGSEGGDDGGCDKDGFEVSKDIHDALLWVVNRFGMVVLYRAASPAATGVRRNEEKAGQAARLRE